MDVTNFKVPIDWQSTSELIYNSLRSGFVDYCYSRSVLKKVIERCKEEKINFVYSCHEDDEGCLEYYKVMPAMFLQKGTFVPAFGINYQIEQKDIPENLCFKCGRYYYDANGRMRISKR